MQYTVRHFVYRCCKSAFICALYQPNSYTDEKYSNHMDRSINSLQLKKFIVNIYDDTMVRGTTACFYDYKRYHCEPAAKEPTEFCLILLQLLTILNAEILSRLTIYHLLFH